MTDRLVHTTGLVTLTGSWIRANAKFEDNCRALRPAQSSMAKYRGRGEGEA